MQNIQKLPPTEHEGQQNEVSDQTLASDDAGAPLRIDLFQQRRHNREIAQRVKHQKQQHKSGNEVGVHLRILQRAPAATALLPRTKIISPVAPNQMGITRAAPN